MIMGLQRIAHMESVFINCVVAGTLENEFSIASRYLKDYKGVFSNSYIKRKTKYAQPQFTNINWYDFGARN